MLSKYIEFDQEAGRHTCAICKGDYVTRAKNPENAYKVLLNHIEAKHLRIKAYFCPYCHKGFFCMSQKSCHITTFHREEHRLTKLYQQK